MKKTLITLLAMTGVAGAWTNSYTNTEFILDGTTTADDRLIFNGNQASSIVVTTTTDTVIGEINANNSTNITAVTFNLAGVFTVIGQTLTGKGADFTTTLNLGESGKFVVVGNSFSSGKNTALTINATLGSGENNRVLIDASSDGYFINAGSITLTINSVDGYANGGLVYEYGGVYYASSDVTNSGGRLTIADTATAMNMAKDTVYTVASMYSLDAGKPVFNKISLMVIPEPATATLSLLALCGLAMRRRRK